MQYIEFRTVDFEEVPGDDPPPTNPNGGTGTSGTTGTTSSSGGVAGPGGLLPNTTTGGLPNAPCSNNCAWYTEAPEQEFDAEPCDPNSHSEEQELFNNYIQMTMPVSFMQGNNSNYGSDPIHYSYTWTVAEGSIAGWKIQAFTDCGYYHTRDYTVYGTVEDNFDLFLFKTGEGYFVGSQTFISSTYTTRNPTTNHVLNNNTQNTSGTSRVIGTVQHTMKMIIPFCENPHELNFTDEVDNSTIFIPR